MSSVECVALSAVAGLFISCSYNVVSYAEHVAATTDTEYSGRFNLCLSFANLFLSLSGIGIFVLASYFGPVSVAMPVQTASNLLLNMIIQSSAGIKTYTKSMRIGTLVLAAAAVCLMDVGPTDPEDGIDVIKLVSTRAARLWTGLMLAWLLVTAIALRHARGSSFAGMMGWAVLVAISTALGATVGKMITATHGKLRAVCFLGYFLMGIGSLLGGLAAARLCDVAVYLPTSQCIQLLINGLTGIFIWGDGKRIQATTSYIMVYFLLLLGVYLCSEIDLLEQVMQRRAARSAAAQRAGAGGAASLVSMDTLGGNPGVGRGPETA